eukprot:CAMPEP_0204009102 /NCGR_PEP_ID=MMETSP0360-20130528/21619_1 /ASSEMBLY_ACC=CAM_ASM_000342 /TAXON_ID=268821 /ORGANISM="Scrippsiella Hangoei, Strain SHTV-5" /LENGTH=104 /DNA_ID=CAMNT_0050951453 /DNA_START=20 /DNA_END=332 /DNA_ORIENTATION=-
MSPSGVAANHAVPPIFTKRTRSCHNRGFASSGYLSKALCRELMKSFEELAPAPAPPRGRPQSRRCASKGDAPSRVATELHNQERPDAQHEGSAQEHNLEVDPHG